MGQPNSSIGLKKEVGGVATVISEMGIILRLVIATGLGLSIGYECERQNQVAGILTHMTLVTEWALAMIVSKTLLLHSGIWPLLETAPEWRHR